MSLSRHARVTIALIVVAGLCAASTAAASAAARLTLGFSGDQYLTGGTSASRAYWIARAMAEGAGIVRVGFGWSGVAPARRPPGFDPSNPSTPGYDWSYTDTVVRDLTSRGIQVLFTITSAPAWAEAGPVPGGVIPGTWRPDPKQFAAFAKAAALRYDGHFSDPAHPGAFLPRVRYWQAWNEPNLDYYLSPQWVRTSRGWAPEAPLLYRQLLNAFYAAVKGVASSNVVLMGGTAPYGDQIGTHPVGQERTPPVDFYRAVFCLPDSALHLGGCSERTQLDAVDHHPYGVVGPYWHALNPGDVAVPDIYKISAVLVSARRAGHVLSRGTKPIWVGEIGWSSSPPNPGGVPLAEQARWYEQALYVLWSQGVRTVLFLELADPPTGTNPSAVFESGLYYCPCYRQGASPKPAATAFSFPFLARRLSTAVVQAWGRAPRAGQIEIEALRGGVWRPIRRFGAGAGQVFVGRLALRGRATLRAVAGTRSSLAWAQGP